MANKYKAIRTTVDGITFHSKKEAKRYQELKMLEKGGKIQQLSLQPKFQITMNAEKICMIILDFKYIENGAWVHEDVKGGKATLTAICKLKHRLLHAQHGIEVLYT